MRFDEPHLMVDAAQHFGEEIGHIGAVDRLGLSERVAGRLPKRPERRSDRECLMVFVRDARGIGDEERALRRDRTAPSAIPRRPAARSAIRSE
jgi:hypothetical protein